MIKYFRNIYFDMRVAFGLNEDVMCSLRFSKDLMKQGSPPSISEICANLTLASAYHVRVTNVMFALIKTLIAFLAVIFALLVQADHLSGDGWVEQLIVLIEIYVLVNFVLLATMVKKVGVLARIIGVSTPMFKAKQEDMSLNHPFVKTYIKGLDGRELLMISEISLLSSFKD